jgi:hypothetical protein
MKHPAEELILDDAEFNRIVDTVMGGSIDIDDVEKLVRYAIDASALINHILAGRVEIERGDNIHPAGVLHDQPGTDIQNN